MNNKKNSVRKISDKFKRNLLFIGVFVIAYILIVTAVTPKQYSLEVGQIPMQDIKAPRDTIDEEATRKKEEQAVAKVDNQYTQKTEVKNTAEDNIKDLFSKLVELSDSNASQSDKISQLKGVGGITLSDNQYAILLAIPKEDLDGIQQKIINIIDNAYKKNIGEDEETELKPARKNAVNEVEKLNLNANLIEVLGEVVEKQINPNFFLDDEKKQEMINEAKKNVTKVMIKQNQIIVKEGVPVTQEQLDILSDLGMLDNDKESKYAYVYIILVLFLSSILFLQYNYIYRNYKDIYNNTKKLVLISVINLGSLVLARAIGSFSPYLIPFACAPMLLTLLLNYKISMFVSILNIILISATNSFDVQVIIVGVVTSLLGATLLKKMQQRNDLIYSTGYIAIVGSVLTLSTGVLISSDFVEVLMKSGFAFIGGALSGVLALGILPFLEGSFNEVTTLKLLELSNPNNVLLKKLLMDAPGTYHHSMLVANLAEMASEEVGANSVVTRIGAYYHDIGKTQKPYFFAENQIGGDNPHNNLDPELSAKIIISHVKDGIELAKKYNIPSVIQDIIAQHHGTTLVKYFYYTAKNNAENPDDIKEENFRYPGPIPNSKESGIIMLADSVEAAVRSIKEPNEDKIKEMVNNIVNDKLSSGQLDNCDLTINDIRKIKKCFLTALNGIYHHRVEYPKEKIKELNNTKENEK
ncbi:HD family phosphohydrolase [Clostridium sp. SM-530-WT-3G]|uniref:HD family phosphohydrolase n=1 Tax=Clostridium sp. SM-530-WT-3G TaxID=2725303 RepID=UPI00145E4A7B|nr:HD family phosphohydrolase [Clostridium sp. SM-530-WT-3G]NME82967.1 HD family phosphohydrolase [Clostridium sp. SM-530-WT-3G]